MLVQKGLSPVRPATRALADALPWLTLRGPPCAQHYSCHAIGNIAAQAPAWSARFATPAAAGALAALAAGGCADAVRAEAASALARLARQHPAVLAQVCSNVLERNLVCVLMHPRHSV